MADSQQFILRAECVAGEWLRGGYEFNAEGHLVITDTEFVDRIRQFTDNDRHVLVTFTVAGPSWVIDPNCKKA